MWLYFRFPLSLRMVEDMLAARGIIASHQTVRLWAEKFGRHFADDIQRRSAGRLGDKWYLDDYEFRMKLTPSFYPHPSRVKSGRNSTPGWQRDGSPPLRMPTRFP
jgi:hypothetical protein